jgi:transposase
MISREAQVDIRYLHRQGLSYREIGKKTGHDPRTVKRYAEHPELIGRPRQARPRASKLDEFAPLISGWLEEDAEYQASWILDQLRKHGYQGGRTIVGDCVRKIKQEKRRIAYLRFETEPGRQAQVDFGDFKVVAPDGRERTLYLFSMILGYSRGLYCEFLDRCDMVSFLEAQQRALQHLGGVPAEILYDRMKNVFIRKLFGKSHFTQGLMTLANHYGFTPKVAPAYSPWVKGKVERPMDFIREGFWRGYGFSDRETANRDLLVWLAEKAKRIHGTTKEPVCERHAWEQQFLMALPPAGCDVSLRLYRKVHKDCTVSIDGSSYEVPHTLVGKKIIIRMKQGILRIFDGDMLMAILAESDRKGQLVRLAGLAEAIRADRKMNARKYAHPKPGKAKATLSPSLGKYQVDVQSRPLSIYRQIGGEVAYA